MLLPLKRENAIPFQQLASALPALISYKGNKKLIWDLGSSERLACHYLWTNCVGRTADKGGD